MKRKILSCIHSKDIVYRMIENRRVFLTDLASLVASLTTQNDATDTVLSMIKKERRSLYQGS